MIMAGRYPLPLPDSILDLPVAPQITARTRFAPATPLRASFITPEEAVALMAVRQGGPVPVALATVTGPGDPLAVPDTLLRTFALLRDRWPDLRFGLRTLGIGSERFASDLARAGVDYVEIVVNGLRSAILEKIYAWIRPGHKTLPLADAVALLIGEQKNGVPALKFRNIKVTITTTLFPGCNVEHVGEIARTMQALGADAISLVPYHLAADAEVSLAPPDQAVMEAAQLAAASYLPVVDPLPANVATTGLCVGAEGPEPGLAPTGRRPNIAVVSTNGIDVDLHLGKAKRLLIYGPRRDGLPCLLAVREAPPSGTGERRWERLAAVLDDCCAIIACQAGERPQTVLRRSGIAVVVASGQIDPLLDRLFGGLSGKQKRRR